MPPGRPDSHTRGSSHSPLRRALLYLWTDARRYTALGTVLRVLGTIRRNFIPALRYGLIPATGRLLLSIFIVLTMMTAGALGLSGHYMAEAVSMAPPSQRLEGDPMGLFLLDGAGQPLFDFASEEGGYRIPIPLQKISPWLLQATIATEDAEFWEHSGINFKGLWRAAYENIAFWEYGDVMQGTGGSSITQQLARNLYFTPEERVRRDIFRKVREAVLAMQLDRHYPKEAILEQYFNVVFYGNMAYGAEAAARRYFNKSAAELSLGQASLLAGLPKAPTELEPVSNYTAARARQAFVLQRMVERGYITQEEAEATVAEEIEISTGAFEINAPHFTMHVRDLIPQLIGEKAARQGGLKVTTTIDPNLQSLAERIVAGRIEELEATVGATNAALVAIDPSSGHVVAMVGSPDYFDARINGQVNNAVALQNPGSSIKPLIYLGAFLKGWSPATLVDDRPLTMNDQGRLYALTNADNRFRGRISVRQALGNSLNPPAVQAGNHAGRHFLVELTGRMGLRDVENPDNYGAAFAVGGLDTRLVDMVFAYSVLANQGEQRGVRPTPGQGQGPRPLEPVLVKRIEDAAGVVLYEATTEKVQIVPPAPSYLITHILSDNGARVLMFGPSSPLVLPGRPAAVKTGLSDEHRDAWAIGYTPQLVAGVWVGNDDNSPLAGHTLSSRTAAPIWNEFMTEALWDQPPLPFEPPPGIVTVPICSLTGQLPVPGCPLKEEVFIAGQQPGRAVPLPARYLPGAAAPAEGEE